MVDIAVRAHRLGARPADRRRRRGRARRGRDRRRARRGGRVAARRRHRPGLRRRPARRPGAGQADRPGARRTGGGGARRHRGDGPGQRAAQPEAHGAHRGAGAHRRRAGHRGHRLRRLDQGPAARRRSGSTVRAEYVVNSTNGGSVSFSQQFVDEIQQLPEVGAATGLGFARLTFTDGTSAVGSAVDGDGADALLDYTFIAGSFADLSPAGPADQRGRGQASRPRRRLDRRRADRRPAAHAHGAGHLRDEHHRPGADLRPADVRRHRGEQPGGRGVRRPRRRCQRRPSCAARSTR